MLYYKGSKEERNTLSRGKRYEEPKLNLKKVFAVVIAFIVLIMCIVMIKGILSKDKEQGNISSKDYFVAYENNKWGVIDSSGNIVIDPSYQEMIIIPNSKNDVFLCTYDVNYDDGTYKTKALNSNNEEIFTDYDKIEAISNTDENNNLSYDGNVLRVQKEGKYGLIDFSGKSLLPCEYDNITSVEGLQGAIKIVKEGKVGVADDKGQILIPTEYNDIEKLGEQTSQGFIVQNEEGKYGIVDISNNQVIEAKYDSVSTIHQGDYYVVTESGKQKIIKKDGTEVLNGDYDEIVSILKNPENGVIYKKQNKYGIMKLDGTITINPNYDDLKEAKTETFIASNNGKYGIIDLSNETKLEFKYQSLTYNEKADIYIGENEQFNNEILDSNYNVRLTGILIDLDDEKGYIEIRQEDEYKYYNFRFEEQNQADIFTNNTLFVSKKDGKYGFVDKNGNIVVDYIYDDATKQNDFGYAGVKKDGKWGAIDKNGKVVQEPTYNLEDYLKVDFIGKWYLGKDLNMNYYRDQ